jgi:photosystem II stability/assembly factor-like uncharacterized protein
VKRGACMRRVAWRLVVSLVCCTAALGGLAASQAAATGTWSAQSSGTTSYLSKVSFVDQNHGWAVGENGTIVATSDGGATWSAQASGTTDVLAGLSFVDQSHGWAVGGSGTIGGVGRVVATSDGGATWRTQSSGTSAFLEGVSFVDPTHGWAVGDGGTIVATSDGGATWRAQSSGTTSNLFSVSFVDPTHGWAVGDDGTIVATSDGGANWRAQTSGTTNQLSGVSFVDSNHGWVVENAGGIAPILATSDGGVTWGEESSTTDMFGLSFVDQSHGWAVGFGGTILATSDGGASWSPQTSGTANRLNGVSFVDQNHGWAVGEGGTILAFADRTAPTTTITLSPGSPNGSNGWYRSAVGVSVSASDPDDSSLQTRCVLDPATAPTTFDQLPAGRCSLSSVGTDGQHVIYAASEDPAGNNGAVVHTSFKVDRTPPAVTLTTPASGARYSVILTRLRPVRASYSCADGGSGIASCTGTLPNGATIPTGLFSIGTHTFTVTARDNAGNTTTVTHTYTVSLL